MSPSRTTPRSTARTRARLLLALLVSLLALAPLPASQGRAAASAPAPHSRAAASTPFVWFAPLPAVAPRPEPERVAYGSSDYMRLFSPSASWSKAARRVDVFKLYGNWIEQASDADLSTIVADLQRRGIALAVELQPLQPSADCGQGVEGFDSLGPLAIANRIRAAGGTIAYAALDEPWFYGALYDGPNACRWSDEQIAQQVVQYVSALRSVFPDVVVGDIEPLPAGVAPARIEQWLDAYRSVSGTPFPFFHLDVTFASFLLTQTWTAQALELEQASRARGSRFGMIYDGNGDSDLGWEQSAERRLEAYELVRGGRPDEVIFQSWVDRPDRVLPEGSSGSFTNLIDRYFRQRPALRLRLGVASGTPIAAGALLSARGRPLARRRIEIRATPLQGVGIRARYAVAGVSPADATQASIGLRINSECGCAGASDLSLYLASYRQAGGPNLVPDPSFDNGLGAWTASGDAATSASADAEPGGGRSVQVQASPSQSSSLDSGSFAVGGGERFALSFEARVAPLSAGSGYFAVFFRNAEGGGVGRTIIPIEPGAITLATPTTSRAGSFHAALRRLPQDPSLVEAWYRGANRTFPAYASLTTP